MNNVKELQQKIEKLESQISKLENELYEQKQVESLLRQELKYTSKKLIEYGKKLKLYPRYQEQEEEF